MAPFPVRFGCCLKFCGSLCWVWLMPFPATSLLPSLLGGGALHSQNTWNVVLSQNDKPFEFDWWVDFVKSAYSYNYTGGKKAYLPDCSVSPRKAFCAGQPLLCIVPPLIWFPLLLSLQPEEKCQSEVSGSLLVVLSVLAVLSRFAKLKSGRLLK